MYCMYNIHAWGAFFYPPLSPKRKLDDDNFFRMGSFSHFLQLRKKLEDLLFFMSGYKDFSQAEVAKVSQIYRAIFHITLQPVAINRTRSLDITTRCSSVYIYLLTLVVFNLTFAFRMMSEWMLLLKIGQMQWRVEWNIVASSSFWMPSQNLEPFSN